MMSSEEDDLTCSVCSAVFTNWRALKIHLVAHVLEAKVTQLNTCDKNIHLGYWFFYTVQCSYTQLLKL